MIPGFIGNMMGGAKEDPAEPGFVNRYSSNSDSSTYTFTGVALSPEMILVILNYNSGAERSITSVTAGGSGTFSVVANQKSASSNGANARIVTLKDVIGATGSIVVQFSSGTQRCAIGVYHPKNLKSLVPIDTGGDPALVATSSVSLAAAEGGIVVAGQYNGNNGIWTWGGADSDFQVTIEDGSQGVGASRATEAGGVITVTAASTASIGNKTLVAATFR